jgi:hypothetical protein
MHARTHACAEYLPSEMHPASLRRHFEAELVPRLPTHRYAIVIEPKPAGANTKHAVCGYVNEHRYDLLVVGMVGRKGPKEMPTLLGSVADYSMREVSDQNHGTQCATHAHMHIRTHTQCVTQYLMKHITHQHTPSRTHKHTHTHTQTHTHTHIHTPTHIHTQAHRQSHAEAHRHTHIHTHTRTHTHTHTHRHMYAC